VPVPPRSILPLLPLPEFRHSEELIDLALPFCTREANEELKLPEKQLSRLFNKPLYQSSSRFNLQANNTKFACLKAFYSESGFQPSPAPVEGKKQELTFESRFESGNLAFAARGQQEGEYYLLLQKDINSTRCTQWFFFRVHNRREKGRARLHILNFFKNYSSYENGMKVLVCSQSNGFTWRRGCEDITYRRTNLAIAGEKNYYALSFTFDF
jgi:hypothetical protein